MQVELINLSTQNNIVFDDNTFVLNNISTDDTAVTHNTSKTIKQIGEYVISSSVSSRTINIIGYIIGASELDLKNKKTQLLNLINPLQNVQIIINGNKSIDAKPLSTVTWGAKWENNNSKFVKFTIDFLAPKTLWKDVNSTIVTFTPWQNDFIFPISIKEKGMIFGHKTRDKFTTVYNESNVALGCKFTLTALADVINPKIINVDTGDYMQLNITLKPQEQLVINTEYNSKKITLNGQNVIHIFDFIGSKWLMLEPGDNIFTYKTENKSEDCLNIELEYFNNYWGVV